MPDFRHKREGGDIGFLVRGSLDGCVSSCSSTRGGADADDDDLGGDDVPDLLARRRRRSDLDGDDIAESSAAARRHSRILSRWVARHAEVMITNIERRNRESELMALAGLQTVSTLDDSFLRGSQRLPSSVERPVSARASTILQMWRELEDMSNDRETRAAATRSSNRTRSGSRAATESDDNGSSLWDRGPLGPIDREDSMEDDADRSSSREQSPDLGDGERERVRQIVRGWTAEERMRDLSSSELSPRNESPRSEWLGVNERERVRLVREWVQMASEQRDARSIRREEIDSNQNRDGSAAIDHQEGQGDHVRRTSLRVRGRQARLDLIMRMARERQRELQGLSEARAVSGFPHRSRIQSLLRGRFLRNGSTTAEEERPLSVAATELGQLRQRHPVSGLREEFRFRLQSIDDRQHISQVDNTSIHDVSDFRNDQSQLANAVELSNYNGNQSESTNVTNDDHQVTETTQLEGNRPLDDMDWRESVVQAEIWQEEALGVHGRRDWQLSADGGLGEWHNEVGEESDGTWHENTDQSWFQRTPEDGVNGHLPESDDWHDNDSQVTVENWLDEPSHSPQNQYDMPIRRVNRFVPSDDDNVYSVELRELLSRRSVSNLLHSGFRESLDRLIRSYVQRQGRGPLDWDLQRTSPTPASTEEDLEEQREVLEEQRDNPGEDQQDSTVRPPVVIPPPPVPPRQPFWHSLSRHNNWNRQSMRRTDTEWDAVNELRAELARLQQAMSNMQRMLEACMDMQLELQRSVRQEVSAALNRSKGVEGLCEEWSDDGSMWTNVKNGTCCVCCDCHIDSLLYRCGHMCTCSKCANELVRSGGKCPLCRAPIIEVIRAYSIL